MTFMETLSIETLISTLIGVLIGGLITWITAWLYYRRASEDLLKESSELKRLNRLMLSGMEYTGWLNLNRDSEGNITGFEQTLKADFISSKSEVSEPTLTENPRNDE